MKRKEFLRTGLAATASVATASLLSTPRATAPDLTHLPARITPAGKGLDGADTYGLFAEWSCVAAPGTGIPPHYHTREDEVFRVYEGELELIVDGKATVLRAGDTAFAPRNLPHAWFNKSGAPVRFSTSSFPAGMEHMLGELASLPPGPPNLEQVAAVCGRYGIHFV
jgi:hypothetical protein